MKIRRERQASNMQGTSLDRVMGRREMRAILRGFGVAVIVLIVLAVSAPAGQEQFPTRPGQRTMNPNDPFGDQDPLFAAKQMRALNADRQKSMIADTNKLVALARELNTEMASDDGDEPSAMQLRKAAEIEKLAHNVKQKMSYSIGNGPQFQEPLMAPIR